MYVCSIHMCIIIITFITKLYMCPEIYVAPVCFNTTYCGGESVGSNLLSYEQCCFELSGVSFATPGQCVLCPKSGTFF